MSGSIGGWQSDTDETSASESVYEDAIDGMEDSSDEELDTSSNTLNANPINDRNSSSTPSRHSALVPRRRSPPLASRPVSLIGLNIAAYKRDSYNNRSFQPKTLILASSSSSRTVSPDHRLSVTSIPESPLASPLHRQLSSSQRRSIGYASSAGQLSSRTDYSWTRPTSQEETDASPDSSQCEEWSEGEKEGRASLEAIYERQNGSNASGADSDDDRISALPGGMRREILRTPVLNQSGRFQTSSFRKSLTSPVSPRMAGRISPNLTAIVNDSSTLSSPPLSPPPTYPLPGLPSPPTVFIPLASTLPLSGLAIPTTSSRTTSSAPSPAASSTLPSLSPSLDSSAESDSSETWNDNSPGRPLFTPTPTPVSTSTTIIAKLSTPLPFLNILDTANDQSISIPTSVDVQLSSPSHPPGPVELEFIPATPPKSLSITPHLTLPPSPLPRFGLASPTFPTTFHPASHPNPQPTLIPNQASGPSSRRSAQLRQREDHRYSSPLLPSSLSSNNTMETLKRNSIWPPVDDGSTKNLSAADAFGYSLSPSAATRRSVSICSSQGTTTASMIEGRTPRDPRVARRGEDLGDADLRNFFLIEEPEEVQNREMKETLGVGDVSSRRTAGVGSKRPMTLSNKERDEFSSGWQGRELGRKLFSGFKSMTNVPTTGPVSKRNSTERRSSSGEKRKSKGKKKLSIISDPTLVYSSSGPPEGIDIIIPPSPILLSSSQLQSHHPTSPKKIARKFIKQRSDSLPSPAPLAVRSPPRKQHLNSVQQQHQNLGKKSKGSPTQRFSAMWSSGATVPPK